MHDGPSMNLKELCAFRLSYVYAALYLQRAPHKPHTFPDWRISDWVIDKKLFLRSEGKFNFWLVRSCVRIEVFVLDMLCGEKGDTIN